MKNTVLKKYWQQVPSRYQPLEAFLFFSLILFGYFPILMVIPEINYFHHFIVFRVCWSRQIFSK